jgi:hypothetical protein
MLLSTFVFRLWVSVMIQESPSQFFPTASGISDRVTRRTRQLQQLRSQNPQTKLNQSAATTSKPKPAKRLQFISYNNALSQTANQTQFFRCNNFLPQISKATSTRQVQQRLRPTGVHPYNSQTVPSRRLLLASPPVSYRTRDPQVSITPKPAKETQSISCNKSEAKTSKRNSIRQLQQLGTQNSKENSNHQLQQLQYRPNKDNPPCRSGPAST